jgi:hypothetical protein
MTDGSYRCLADLLIDSSGITRVEKLWKRGSFGGRLKRHASKSLRIPVRMHYSLDISWWCDTEATPEMTLLRRCDMNNACDIVSGVGGGVRLFFVNSALSYQLPGTDILSLESGYMYTFPPDRRSTPNFTRERGGYAC